ncbi:MAG: TonB-dependent receptor [Gammaproteobacteria bacterium]|nr:TonB-dependent receptor [Gammaproteobacteria bacterium]MDE2347370.1 TonB-dependent receptor [Gammaproteobacteria bacterium]
MLLFALLFAAGEADASGGRIALVDLIGELTAAGATISYSSELVPADATVAVAKITGAGPVERLASALATRHLALSPIGPNRYLITPGEPIIAPSPARIPAPAAFTRRRIFEMPQIPVIVSRYRLADDFGERASALDAHRFTAIPGAESDPLRGLRAAPGIAAAVSVAPSIRGAAPADSLVRFDGIPIMSAFHFTSFQSLASVFDPDAVGGVSVYTGGYPVSLGTRSGAVIDLEPRSIDRGSEVGIGASLRSYSGMWRGRSRTGALQWFVGARRSADQSTLLPVAGNSGEPLYSDSVGRFSRDTSQAGTWVLGWLAADDRLSTQFGGDAGNGDARSHDLNTWLSWRWTSASAMRERTDLYVARADRTRRGRLALPGVASGMVDDERRFTAIGLQSDWVVARPRSIRWNFGATLLRESAVWNYASQSLLDPVMARAFDRPSHIALDSAAAPSGESAALYASAGGRRARLQYEVGVRVDAQAYTGQMRRAQFAPRVDLRYQIAPRWRGYGSWGVFSQAQRVDEFRAEMAQTRPDSATRATHLVGGITYRATGQNWRIEAYRNRWTAPAPYFDNLLGTISVVPELEPGRVAIAPSRAQSQGIEVSMTQSVGRRANFSSSYVLSRAVDVTAAGEVARPADQRQAFSLGGSWTPGDTLVSFLFTWHSGWPRTPITFLGAGSPTDGGQIRVGARNTARWDGFVDADLRITHIFHANTGEFSIWIEGDNVVDRANACCVELIRPDFAGGRPGIATRPWSGRVVNVGLNWRWRTPGSTD